MFEQYHKELTEFLEDLTPTLHCELIELIIRQKGKVLHVEAIVDKENGGINLDECSAVNKQLARYIDEKNLIAEDYVVEVSSPGLDRPLKTQKDFKRVKELEVRFHLKDMIEGKKEHMGIVKEVADNAVTIETKKAAVIEIPLEKIQKAVLILD